jgi:hypothetical protein
MRRPNTASRQRWQQLGRAVQRAVPAGDDVEQRCGERVRQRVEEAVGDRFPGARAVVVALLATLLLVLVPHRRSGALGPVPVRVGQGREVDGVNPVVEGVGAAQGSTVVHFGPAVVRLGLVGGVQSGTGNQVR